MNPKTALLATVVALSGGTATAQEPSLKILRIETPTAEALWSAEAVLMKYAGPVPTKAEPGDTWRMVIDRKCPGVTADYLDQVEPPLAFLNAPEGAALKLEHPAPTDRDIFLPYCVGSELTSSVIGAGDTVWNLFESQRADPDGFREWGTFQKEFARLNGSADVPLGMKVFIPKAALRIPVWSDTLDTVGKDLTTRPGIDRYMDAGPKNWGVLQSDSLKDPCEDLVDEAMSLRLSQQHFRQVALALTVNRLIDDGNRWNRTWDRQFVAILDSGIEDGDAPVSSYPRTNMGPSSKPEDIQVDPRDDRKYHGSGVRTVAFGGHLLSWVAPMIGILGEAPFRIMSYECDPPRNIMDRLPASCQVAARDSRLIRALGLVKKSGERIAVVNISTVFSAEISGFADHLNSDAWYLIVVAAGNEGRHLNEASNPYPARYGGQELYNLLTVAGLDSNGVLMATSNRSKDHVDIGAPGCFVPVLEYDKANGGYEISHRSGTSYAAPQVSFVAAMLAADVKQGTGGISPIGIKKRILFSADIDGLLWDEIMHGRRLNVRKALSVYADMVEMEDGRLMQGKVEIAGGAAEVVLCPDAKVARKDIRKIARLAVIPEDAAAKRHLIYTEQQSTDRRVRTLWCDAVQPKVTIVDVFTGTRTDLDMTKVKDIVFASQPYWE